MINNIDLIKPLLNFTQEGDFYMLYIFKRKKDQPEDEKVNSQSVRTIKVYCIESIDHLEKRFGEIQHLCEYFKARAYIHVQKQNHKDVGLEMMVQLANGLKGQRIKYNNLFDSVVGQIKTNEKRWIVDIDTKDYNIVLKTIVIINATKPVKDKIITIIPTKNGFHLITERFDVLEYQKAFKEDIPGIQKKNPTLLFLPNSLS